MKQGVEIRLAPETVASATMSRVRKADILEVANPYKVYSAFIFKKGKYNA
jgi:hypothetical protein